ncbi:hypothetical protein WNY98_18425 [Pseudoalteromonas sp. AS71]|uniref:hypothetical protein n=1 Tax=Pseudoalteromonas sp. AS71 TaxID=3135777 RepID=UPI00317D71CB
MDFDQILQKPNIAPFDSNTQRIRRNLIVTSIIAIVMTLGSASFNGSQNSFAGFKFENLNICHVYVLLLISIAYFLIHFIWSALDDLKENRLKLTGIKIPKARVASYASSNVFEPNSDEERQSTLFSWWKAHRNQIDHFESIIDSIEEYIKSDALDAAINTSRDKIKDIHTKTIFIEHALLKFEKGFWGHVRSQILRWFLFDFGVPCILALVSCCLILIKIYGGFY